MVEAEYLVRKKAHTIENREMLKANKWIELKRKLWIGHIHTRNITKLQQSQYTKVEREREKEKKNRKWKKWEMKTKRVKSGMELVST